MNHERSQRLFNRSTNAVLYTSNSRFFWNKANALSKGVKKRVFLSTLQPCKFLEVKLFDTVTEILDPGTPGLNHLMGKQIAKRYFHQKVALYARKSEIYCFRQTPRSKTRGFFGLDGRWTVRLSGSPTESLWTFLSKEGIGWSRRELL